MPRSNERTAAQRRDTLRRIMRAHDLSSVEVAVLCDVSRHTVLAWTSGARNIPQRALRLLLWELRSRLPRDKQN